jgi:hypothetical protein
MNEKIYKEVIAASKANNIAQVKVGLKALDFIKQFNPIKDIYFHFKRLQQTELERYSYQSESRNLMVNLLINAASNNNIDFCNYLIHSKDLKINADLNDANVWVGLIEVGNLDIIKSLVNINANDKRPQMIVSSIQYARNNAKSEILEYLIDDPSMPFNKAVNVILKENSNYMTRTHNYEISNICQTFINACSKNNKNLADYLLQHNEYGKMIDSFIFFEGVKAACYPNAYQLMDYLLTDKDMPFKPYEDYNPERLLQITTRHNYDDILNYLVMDFNIKKPDNFFRFFDTFVIAHHVSSFSEQSDIDEFNEKIVRLNELFEKRDLHNKLQVDLKKNNTSSKSPRKL